MDTKDVVPTVTLADIQAAREALVGTSLGHSDAVVALAQRA